MARAANTFLCTIPLLPYISRCYAFRKRHYPRFPRRLYGSSSSLCALARYKRFLRIAVFGLFGISACSLSYLSAIQYANAGTATVLQSLNVVFMSIYGAILLRQTLSRWQSIAIVLALLGVFFIATGGRLDAMVLSPYGLFWGIGAAVASCVYTVLPQRAIAKWGTLAVNGLGMLIAGLVMSAFIVPAYDTPTLDMVGIMAVLFIIIVGTVFPLPFPARRRRYWPRQGYFYWHAGTAVGDSCILCFLGTPFTDTDLLGSSALLRPFT